VGTCFDRKGDGGWRGLLKKIRIVTDGRFFVFDITEQGLDFVQAFDVGRVRALGFLEVTFEGFFFDGQLIESVLEIVGSGLADFFDLNFQAFELG
jgi:hypothetical protein